MTGQYVPERRGSVWAVAGYGGNPELREGTVITVRSERAAGIIAGYLGAMRSAGASGTVVDYPVVTDILNYLLAAYGGADRDELLEAIRGAHAAGLGEHHARDVQPA
jgi:hypothetical protein